MVTNPKGPVNPDRTVILVADTGKIYKLTSEVWEQSTLEMTDPASLGIVNQLEAFGSYLAFVPQDIAIGLGTCCIVLNQKLVLAAQGQSTVTQQTASPSTSGKS